MLVALTTALWLGILTSISPCPLTTNIAAVSFIGRRVDKPFYVLFTGIFYAVGRSVAYAALGILLVNGLLSMSSVSYWLQKYMNKLLGPVLIITAMVLLDLIKINTKGTNIGQWAQKQAENFGLTGAFFLGAVFALSFCPVSAALFFGSLIPLSVKHSSGTLLPFVYGIGTALPVFAFAVLIAAGAASLAKAFQKVSRFELWARRITGIVFLLIGIYFTLAYTLALKNLKLP